MENISWIDSVRNGGLNKNRRGKKYTICNEKKEG